MTPRSQLHFAIWLGNKDVFQTIWDKIGAKDKTEPDETDMVPLQYAAEYGDCEIFKTIYENSVDKDPRGRYGYSLLHHAADNGRFEIIDEILKKVRIFIFFKGKSPGAPSDKITSQYSKLKKFEFLRQFCKAAEKN